MKIPLLDIPASYDEILADVEKNIDQVIQSGQFILGPIVEELEKKISAYCRTSYAVGVSSGTDALLISLMAAGIGEGDEVITSPFTFFATAGSIARLGARPVFVDIETTTWNIDCERVRAAITAETSAIMCVHMYGMTCNVIELEKIAKQYQLALIEDASQVHGAEVDGRPCGSFGDVSVFSFFANKG